MIVQLWGHMWIWICGLGYCQMLVARHRRQQLTDLDLVP